MMNKRLIGTVVCLAVILLTTLASSEEALAQEQGASNPAVSPLVRVLHAKGILTDEEMTQINQASSSGEADQRLAKLGYDRSSRRFRYLSSSGRCSRCRSRSGPRFDDCTGGGTHKCARR